METTNREGTHGVSTLGAVGLLTVSLLAVGLIIGADPAQAASCGVNHPEAGIYAVGDKCGCKANITSKEAGCAACDYGEGQTDCTLDYGW